MTMNIHHHQNTQFCHYHPKQFLVGVCPFCLNEKLLIVVAKQRSHSRTSSHVSLPKLFAFSSLLGHRHHNHQQTFFDCDGDGGFSYTQSTSSSLEDSFISIKFEDNGIGLWDKNEVSKASQDQDQDQPTTTINATHNKRFRRLSSWRSSSHKSTVSNTPRGPLRWRKRIGHFLQLVRIKRPDNKNKVNSGASHVDGVESLKFGNKGWMRSQTKRRTTKE